MTENLWEADRPRGSLAVTVTVVDPGRCVSTDMVSLSTRTEAMSLRLEDAEKESRSSSGSAKAPYPLNQNCTFTRSVRSGIRSDANGLRLIVGWAGSGSGLDGAGDSSSQATLTSPTESNSAIPRTRPTARIEPRPCPGLCPPKTRDRDSPASVPWTAFSRFGWSALNNSSSLW